MASRSCPATTEEGRPESAAPEGWFDLAQHPDDGVAVHGLLSDGTIVDAEWWGPVPEEMWSLDWDGSGWAWDAGGLPDLGGELVLVAWAPVGSGSTSVAAQVHPPIREDK